VGDSFRILNWGSKKGGFSAANGFDLGGGLYFQGIADKSGLTLVTKTSATPATPPPTNLVDQVVAIGDTAVFSFSPLGVAPFTWQWSFTGTNLVGETNAILVITNVQATNLGNYLRAGHGCAGRQQHLLRHAPPPLLHRGIASQPSGQTVANGANLTLTAVGNGGKPAALSMADQR